MTFSEQLADAIRRLHFGKSWVATDLKKQLADVTWEEALTKVASLNTIMALTYHMHYYFAGVLAVMRGGDLTIRDKFSFDHPTINSQEDWEKFLDLVWETAESFAKETEQMGQDKLESLMTEEKYGSWFRNVLVILEHAQYHLGQIVLLKKLIREGQAEQ
ncbi:MAG: DUF1572 domain-containing protein [Saprospiraceae bacterium]|nr:DUF1572 domain-containing protein [Saprospiraceae bacterium]